MSFLNIAFVLGLAAIAAQASPFTNIKDAEVPNNALVARQEWQPPVVPPNWVDKSNEMTGEELIATYGGQSGQSNRRDLVERASGCSQGNCPDRDDPFHSDAPWDLEFQFTVIPDGGEVPLPIFTQEFHLRVDDCNQCQRIKTSYSAGENGCYDFNSCGRDQTICLDAKNSRAHRQYKDDGHKDCFNIITDAKDQCGFVKSTVIWSAGDLVPCNW